MPFDTSLRDPILINSIGHLAGLLLFGFFIVLLLRDRRAHGARQIRLSLVAALLALSWNIGSLVALSTPVASMVGLHIIMTASFSVLSLLPAVLLQLTLERKFTRIAQCGYAASFLAITLHVSELFTTSSAPHQIALVLIAAGFSGLTLTALLLKYRDAPELFWPRREWLSMACLLVFVSSFPHFGYQHFRSPWTAEIAWHHIGIPVALIVLLQDYRFLLLDTFIRFLMNSGLAVIYVFFILILNNRFHIGEIVRANSFLMAVVLAATCLSLILFAHARNVLQRWIGLALFRRQDLELRIRQMSTLSSRSGTEEELLTGAARQVADHLRVDQAVFVSKPVMGKLTDRTELILGAALNANCGVEFAWVEAQVRLRFSSGGAQFLLMGVRRGRQRYLSEDMDDIRRLSAVIIEQVERFRSEELRRLATDAELRALQAQVNPHFLFNALNTLYGTIDRGSFEARRLVLNLSDIFRYFLQGDRLFISLSEELRIIKAYLEIEVLRLGSRLEIELDVSDNALPLTIPILSIQPIVENAVKHGVAAKAGRGRVTVRAHQQEGMLRITVEDISLGESVPSPYLQVGAGIGLSNVRRRLDLSYGAASTLDVRYGAQGCIATFMIPASKAVNEHERLPSIA